MKRVFARHRKKRYGNKGVLTMKQIYLDYLASTPVDPAVLAEMQPYFADHADNPANTASSGGMYSAESVTFARKRVAKLLGVHPDTICFTSGATESNNLVIRGVVEALYPEKNRVITSAAEHASVLFTVKSLERHGIETIVLPVDRDARVDPAMLESSLNDRTALVSIMHANNELGTIQDISVLARICAARGVLFHSDIAQSCGKVRLDAAATGIDFATLSSHKMYGPKGCGALYVKSGRKSSLLVPQTTGGGQEDGLRSGTLNVPCLVGFGKAASLCADSMDADGERLLAMRKKFESTLVAAIPWARINSRTENSLPNVTHVSFAGTSQGALVSSLRSIAISSDSACATDSGEPSHVLLSCGLMDMDYRAALRISTGRPTTEMELELASGLIIEAARKCHKF
jgi:cysteine desulfurase